MYSYMTRSEFIVRANQWRTRMMWIYLQLVLVVGMLFVGFWYLVRHVEMSQLTYGALFIAMILVPSTLFGRMTSNATRELGLICPHCKKTLVSLSSPQGDDTVGQGVYQVTVTTGLCGRCGGQVLQEGTAQTHF
jgi:uncharacterized membrane protein